MQERRVVAMSVPIRTLFVRFQALHASLWVYKSPVTLEKVFISETKGQVGSLAHCLQLLETSSKGSLQLSTSLARDP